MRQPPFNAIVFSAMLSVLLGGCGDRSAALHSSMGGHEAASGTTAVASSATGAKSSAGGGAVANASTKSTEPGSLGLVTKATSELSLYGQLPESEQSENADPAQMDNFRQVTFTLEGDDFDPCVDPSGKWLVFASTRHRATADIYLQQVDGTTVTQLTDDPADDAMPVFSPDGRRIAFCSRRTGSWNIFLLSLDGGQPVQVTNDASQNIHPSFSPDGKMLVYSSQSSQSGQWEMIVVDLEKTGAKHYIGAGLFPDWSPTTNKIVFQKARERGTRWFSIWTLDYVNGEGVRPTEIVASANAACINPHWSPDGKRIVFSTVVNPQGSDPAGASSGSVAGRATGVPMQADVWVMGVDGSGRANLTHNRFVNVLPVWAGDGTIYFVSRQGSEKSDNIWAVRPDRAMANGTVGPMPGVAASAAKHSAASAAASSSMSHEEEAGEEAVAEVGKMVSSPASSSGHATAKTMVMPVKAGSVVKSALPVKAEEPVSGAHEEVGGVAAAPHAGEAHGGESHSSAVKEHGSSSAAVQGHSE